MVRQGASRRFRFAQAEAMSTPDAGGAFILNTEGKRRCTIEKPSWNFTQTIIRILPGRNPDNVDEFDPTWLSDDPSDFGDWIRAYPAVTSIGSPGVSFLYHDPRDGDVDLKRYPVWVLRSAVLTALRNGQGLPVWSRLGSEGDMPIKSPGVMYMVQALVFMQGSRPKNPPVGAPGDKTCVFRMSKTAGEAVRDAVIQAAANNVDAIRADGGLLFTLAQAAADPNSRSSFSQYECSLSEQYGQITPSLLNYPGWESQVQPWDSVIQVLSIEEQVRLLCTCGIPASAIVFALDERFGEFIPDATYEQAYLESNGRFGRPPATVETVPPQQTGYGQPAPTQSAPTQPAPTQPAPTQPAPTQPAPTQVSPAANMPPGTTNQSIAQPQQTAVSRQTPQQAAPPLVQTAQSGNVQAGQVQNSAVEQAGQVQNSAAEQAPWDGGQTADAPTSVQNALEQLRQQARGS